MPFSNFLSSLSCVSEKSSQRRTVKLKKKNNKAPTLNASAPGEELNETVLEERISTISSYLNDRGEIDSFWDVGKFKVALKRCDNGQKLGTDLAELISERAKLEDNYGKAIKNWSHKWNEHLIGTSSPEYETTKDAWVMKLNCDLITLLFMFFSFI